MKTLKEIGEFSFIKNISKGCLIRPYNVIKSIGDDAAVFKIDDGQVILVTTDLLAEGVHFIKNKIKGFDLGYKSLAVNLSDIAAMGGYAKEAFISIAIPENCSLDYLSDFYNGIKELSAQFDINILGGDTTSSKNDLIINLTVIGTAKEDKILYRDSAKIGDIICVTGFLGDSKAGLYLLLNDIKPEIKEFKNLIQSHIKPKPYIKEGQFLSFCGKAHAAIDVSDGLSSDVWHIAEESNVGIKIFADKLPISEDLIYFCNKFNFNSIDMALSGGEDYVLLCSLSKEEYEQLIKDYNNTFDTNLYPIGEITDTKKMEIVYADGTYKDFYPSGWEHFATPSSEH